MRRHDVHLDTQMDPKNTTRFQECAWIVDKIAMKWKTDPEETALNLVLNYIFRDNRQKKNRLSAKLNGRLRISKESSETLIRLARKWLKVNASGNGNCSIVSNVQMKNDVDLQHFSVYGVHCYLLFSSLLFLFLFLFRWATEFSIDCIPKSEQTFPNDGKMIQF